MYPRRYTIYRLIGLSLCAAALLGLVWGLGAQRAAASPTANAVVGPPCGEPQFDAALNSVQTSGGGTITFNCGGAKTIPFTFAKSINANVTINGGTPGLITLSGSNAYLFQVSSGKSLTLRNLTLANSSSIVAGAIENFGVTTIENCTLTNNQTTGSGGAVTNFGALNVVNSTFSNNRAFSGGAIYIEAGGAAAITSTIIVSNSAEADGGGIYNGGALTLTNTTLSRNAVLTETGVARGGGAYNSGQFSMVGGSVIGNYSPAGNFGVNGGGLHNDGFDLLVGSMELNGVLIAGNVVLSGTAGGVGNVDGTVILRHVNIYSNTGGITGGGVSNSGSNAFMHIANSEITHNTSALGGGLYLSAFSTVISQTRVSANDANFGGGIRNYQNSLLRLYQSTLDNNLSHSDGGGIANRGVIDIQNSTLSGNVANDNSNNSEGGGIFSEQSALVVFVNATLNGNKANIGGNLRTATSALLDTTNTIIAGSRDQDTNAVNDNCALVSNIDRGGNKPSDDTCLLSASTAVDSLLGPLTFNGGPTLTHMPQAGSPAIDGGTNTSCPAADQRGAARPVNGTCDSGAVEFGAKLPMAFMPMLIAMD